MCLTGAVFINVRRQLECLHFPCPSQLCEWSPLANSFDVWHSPRVSYRYSCFFNTFLTDKQRYPTLLAIFRPSITPHLRKFYSLRFFFFNFSEPMCSADGAVFFFHMKFRFSILWKNNIGVSWDEFPSNNGFNIKHLSIVAKKKS